MSANVCEMDDLFCLLPGITINSKIKNPCKKLWGKLVYRSALVQKARYALCHGPQCPVQLSNLW